MWLKVSGVILRYKIFFLSVLLIITAFFGYYALRVEMSYEYASLLPKKDQAYSDYRNFVEIFGEEGNLIIIGIKDTNFFEIGQFKQWREFGRELSEVEGVENLLTVTNAYNLKKNSEERRFEIEQVFPDSIKTQEELDYFATKFKSLPFYKNTVYNPESNTYLLALTINKERMLTKSREKMVKSIQKIGRGFEKSEGVKLHYSCHTSVL